MANLNQRIDKLEATNKPGLHLLFLDKQQGETEEEAKARISAGFPGNATIVWLSWMDTKL